MPVIYLKGGQPLAKGSEWCCYTGHESRYSVEAGGWTVSWLPNLVLSRADAHTAMLICEAAGECEQETDDAADRIREGCAELGLDASLDEVLEAARRHGPVDGMRSSTTGHEARWSDEEGGWTVSWLPGRVVTQVEASYALEVSELACVAEQVRDNEHAERDLDELLHGLGLAASLDELAELAGGRGPADVGNRGTKRHPRVMPPTPVEARMQGPGATLRGAPVPYPRGVPPLPIEERMREVGAPMRGACAAAPPTPSGAEASVAPLAVPGAPGPSAAEGSASGPRLTSEMSTGQLRDAMVAAAVELAEIVGAAEAARDELAARGWAGLEQVAAACELLARPMEVLVTVGEKVSVAGAVIRAAYLAAPMVGEKSTVVETGESGSWSPAQTAVAVAASPSLPLVAAPPAEMPNDGAVSWRAMSGPAQRCTAPREGWQRFNLCTACESAEDREACPWKHGPPYEREWRLWGTDLDGNPDLAATREIFDDDEAWFISVDQLLDEVYDQPGLWVAQELGTGRVWSVEELWASYPEVLAQYRAEYQNEERD